MYVMRTLLFKVNSVLKSLLSKRHSRAKAETSSNDTEQVVPRYSSRKAGSYLRNKPKKRSATQATQTAISHLHRSMIYLTFMMNIILFRTAVTFSVSWLITLSLTDVHILSRQSVKSNFVYFRSFS